MADFYQEITTWLAAQTGLVIGADIFGGSMPPEEKNNAVTILDRGGLPQGGTSSEGNTAQIALQVLSRGMTYKTGLTLSQDIFDVLHKTAQQIDLGSWQILNAVASARPAFIGYDEKKRYMFSHNYIIYAATDW